MSICRAAMCRGLCLNYLPAVITESTHGYVTKRLYNT